MSYKPVLHNFKYNAIVATYTTGLLFCSHCVSSTPLLANSSKGVNCEQGVVDQPQNCAYLWLIHRLTYFVSACSIRFAAEIKVCYRLHCDLPMACARRILLSLSPKWTLRSADITSVRGHWCEQRYSYLWIFHRSAVYDAVIINLTATLMISLLFRVIDWTANHPCVADDIIFVPSMLARRPHPRGTLRLQMH